MQQITLCKWIAALLTATVPVPRIYFCQITAFVAVHIRPLVSIQAVVVNAYRATCFFPFQISFLHGKLAVDVLGQAYR